MKVVLYKLLENTSSVLLGALVEIREVFVVFNSFIVAKVKNIAL